MIRHMLKSKIHRAVLTATELNYEGSITIDPDLMEPANIFPAERVQVLDLNNGARFETYTIKGKRGSGEICLNGPAARLAEPGDTVIVVSYCMVEDAECKEHETIVVHPGPGNTVAKIEKKGI